MSQIKSVDNFRLGPHDRLVRLSGPETGAIYGWMERIRKENTFLFELIEPLTKTLARGSMFDEWSPLVMTTEQIEHLLLVYQQLNPTDPTSLVVQQVLTAALAGEVRVSEAERAAEAARKAKAEEVQKIVNQHLADKKAEAERAKKSSSDPDKG